MMNSPKTPGAAPHARTYRRYIPAVGASLLLVVTLFLSSVLFATRASAKPVEGVFTPPVPVGTQENVVATQQHNGRSVTVRWVYLDVTRFGVEYEVQGASISKDGRTLCPLSATVYTEPGVAPVTQEAGDFYCVSTSPGTFLVSQSFDRSVSGTSAITSALHLDVESGASTFDFDFALTPSSGLSVAEPVAQSHHGVPVTLMRAAVNPSVTEVDLCITLPTTADWLPEATLSANATSVYGNWRLLKADDPATFQTQNRCYRYQFPMALNPNALDTPIVLTLAKLQTSISEQLDNRQLDSARTELASAGITVDVVPAVSGYGLDLTQKPVGMTEEAAYAAVINALTETVTGPWAFTIVP